MGKFALLIGVGDYQSQELQNLAAAIPDVRAIEKVLIDPTIADFARTDVMVLLNPEPQKMRETIEHLFVDRKKDDLLLLYFSGHGVTNDFGNFYFTSAITQKNRLDSTAIPATFVHGLMEASRSQRQVVILDSCFSGAFAKEMKAKGEAVNLQPQLGGKGRAVLTSSSATEYSFEQKEGKLSVYTQYLEEGLRTGIADGNEDGWISVDDLHKFAGAKVREVAPAMNPKIYVVEAGYEIILAKAPMGDPELEYRKEVEQWAKRRNGKLSATILMALEEKQRQWNLTSEVAVRIQHEVLRPYKEFDAKIQRYQRALQEEMRSTQRITSETWEDLEYLRETLGLTGKNIEFLVKDVEILSSHAPSEGSETPTRPVPNFFTPLPSVDSPSSVNNTPETRPIALSIPDNSILERILERASLPRERTDRSLQKVNKKHIKPQISCKGLMLALLSIIGAGVTLVVIVSSLSSPKTSTTSVQPKESISPVVNLNSEEKKRPFIGISMVDLTPELSKEIRQDPNSNLTLSKEKGVLVATVVKGQAAEVYGMLAGDVFQKVNGKSVTTTTDVSEIIAATKIGDDLAVEVDRDGKILTLKVKVGTMPEYRFLYRQGIEKSDKKDFKGAIEDYNKVIALKSDYAEAYNGRGVSRSNLSDYKGAIEEYTKALELKSSESWIVYSNRGNSRKNLSDDKGAIEDYTKAIELKPDYANSYYNRAVSRTKLKENDKAIADYQQAADLYQKQGKTQDYQETLDRIKKLQ